MTDEPAAQVAPEQQSTAERVNALSRHVEQLVDFIKQVETTEHKWLKEEDKSVLSDLNLNNTLFILFIQDYVSKSYPILEYARMKLKNKKFEDFSKSWFEEKDILYVADGICGVFDMCAKLQSLATTLQKSLETDPFYTDLKFSNLKKCVAGIAGCVLGVAMLLSPYTYLGYVGAGFLFYGGSQTVQGVTGYWHASAFAKAHREYVEVLECLIDDVKSTTNAIKPAITKHKQVALLCKKIVLGNKEGEEFSAADLRDKMQDLVNSFNTLTDSVTKKKFKSDTTTIGAVAGSVSGAAVSLLSHGALNPLDGAAIGGMIGASVGMAVQRHETVESTAVAVDENADNDVAVMSRELDGAV